MSQEPFLNNEESKIELSNQSINSFDFTILKKKKDLFLSKEEFKAKDIDLEKFLDFYSQNEMKKCFFNKSKININYEKNIRKPILFIKSTPNPNEISIIYYPNSFLIYDLLNNTSSREITIDKKNFQIYSMCFNDDGSQIFIGGNDSSIYKYIKKSEEVITYEKELKGHSNYISCLGYSLKKLFSGSFDNSLRIWNSEGEKIKCIKKHKDKITCLSISKNGIFIATGSCDYTVRIFDTQDGSEVKNLTIFKNEISSIYFPQNGDDKIVVGCLDMTIHLINLNTKTEKIIYYKENDQNVEFVKFSNDGKWIVSVINNNTIIFWNVYREIEEFRICDGNIIGSLTFDKNSKYLYYNTTKEIYQVKIEKLDNIISKIIPQENNFENFILTHNKKIITWDANNVYFWIESNYGTLIPDKKNNDNRIKISKIIYVCISRNEEYLAVSTRENDGKIHFYNYEQLRITKTCTCDTKMYFNDMKFSKKIKFFFAKLDDQTKLYYFINLNDNLKNKLYIIKPKEEDIINKEDYLILNYSISEDENFLFVLFGERNNKNIIDIYKFNEKNDRKFSNIMSLSNDFECFRFSLDNKYLLTSNNSNNIIIWTLDFENCLIIPDKKLNISHKSEIISLEITEDYKIISVGHDKNIIVTNMITGQEEIRFQLADTTHILFFLESNQSIYCLNGKNLIKIKLLNYMNYTNIHFVSSILEKEDSIQVCLLKYPQIFSKENITNLVLNSEIFPFNLGVFHYLAYRKEEKKIKAILSLCDYYDINPKFSLNSYENELIKIKKETPLDIAVRKNDISSMHVIIKSLTKTTHGPKCCPSINIKTLSRLITCENSYIAELLESRFCEPYVEDKLPRTYSSFDIPLQSTLNKVMINKKDIDDLLSNRTEAMKKTFKKSLLNNQPCFAKLLKCIKRRINLDNATKEDVNNELIKRIEIKMIDLPGIVDFDNNFIEKCYELDPEHPLFNNNVFLSILQYKWDSYAKEYFLNSALIFLIYMLILTINSIYLFPKRIEIENKELLSVNLYSLGLNILLAFFFFRFIIYEVYTLIRLRWFYFFNFWNYIDLPIFYFLGYLLTIDILNIFDEYDDILNLKIYHAITLFLTYLRFITFARGFESIAFIVRLIFQVTTDMVDFLIIMFFIILALSFSVYLLQINEQTTFFDSFNSFYRLILGDFSGFDNLTQSSFSYNLIYLFFLFGTLVIMVVMLNLLISIISDTYGRVSGMKKLSNAYEKTRLIIEIDRKITNKIKFKFKDYLYIAKCIDLKDKEDVENIKESNIIEDENSNDKLIKRIYEKLEIMEMKINTFETNHENTENLNKIALFDNKTIIEKLENLEKKLLIKN